MSKVCFRIAAALLVLFAAGHTFGFLMFHAPTAEARGVWEAMNRVRFSDGRSSFSYADFYVGFGLFISAFLLFTAWLAWMLPSIEDRRLAWGMVALQLVSAGIAARYFAWPPLVMSVATAACLAMGAWRMAAANHVRMR